MRFTGGLCGLYDPVERTDFFLVTTMKPIPTFDQINEALSYDPETGTLTWKHRADSRSQVNSRCAGVSAGSLHAEGYYHLAIRISGVSYRLRSHRVAWLLMTGEWPSDQIDHKDTDKGNNRWINLRCATHGQNQANKRTYAKSGFKGVTFNPGRNTWRAQININGKSKGLGTYKTGEEAHAAFCEAAEKQHGVFANHLSD